MTLILDQRRERRALERLSVNHSNPALAYELGRVDWQSQPELVGMIQNMRINSDGG